MYSYPVVGAHCFAGICGSLMTCVRLIAICRTRQIDEFHGRIRHGSIIAVEKKVLALQYQICWFIIKTNIPFIYEKLF